MHLLFVPPLKIVHLPPVYFVYMFYILRKIFGKTKKTPENGFTSIYTGYFALFGSFCVYFFEIISLSENNLR